MVDKLRKIFVVFAIVAVAVMGMPVNPAKAVTVSAGDLVKASGPAVYYYASNGKRYVFPTEKTYRTWYPDFSTIKVITDAELASIQIGGNIVYRPGTRLAKITTDPKTYAVGPKGVLHWITSEAVAISMYGSTWASMIDDIPDAFFTNYTYGSDIVSAQHPDSTLIKYAGSNDIYVLEDGEKRLISDEAAFMANGFMGGFVLTIADTTTYPTNTTAVSVAETRFTDTAQLWGSPIVPVTGDLTVSVSSATPASFTAPLGGVGIEVAKFNFTAGSSDVTLNGLTLTREGLGNTNEIDRVYLYNGANKLTSGRSLSSTTHTALFTNLGVNIPANSTVTLTVKVDTSAINGGGSHRMTIDGVGDVDADASVGGIFPVSGNTFTISTSVNVGIADVESNGTDYTRKVGEANVEVGNFTVYVDNTENAQLETITLYNSGRDILSNFTLYRGTTLVATGSINGDYVTFELSSPYEIPKGDSAKFTVKADVSGRDGDTATLSVRYKTDVRIKGLTYGYPLGLEVAQGASAVDSYIDEIDSTPSSNTTTAEAGQLTASFNGPVAADVAKNTNDIVLMNFALTAQTTVDVEKTTIDISGNANLVSSDVEDLELVCNGVIVTNWSTVNIFSDTATLNTSTDYWTLPAGGANCVVRIDITNSAAGDETIYATLKDMDSASGNWTFKDSDTGDSLTDIVPTGDIQGNTMTVTEASLTINTSSTPALGNVYVPNSADVSAVGFIMTAGAASDVRITSVKLTAYLDDDDTTFAATDMDETSGAKNVIGVVRLYDEAGTQIGTSKSLVVGSSDITASFTDLDYTITAGNSEKITAKVDISSTAPICVVGEEGVDTVCGTEDDVNSDFIALAIAVNTDVVAEYGTGTNLVPTLTNGNATPDIYQEVTTTGTLAATLDADTVLSSLVLSGASADVTKIKFSATNEAIKVEKLRVVNTAGVGDDAQYVSATISYTNSAGNTETKTAYFSGDAADFNVLDILVPKDSYTIVTFRGNFNTIAGGATNDVTSALSLDFDTNFRAVTQGSGKVTSSVGAANVDGNDMYLFDAYPVFTVSETNGTLTPNANTLVGTITINNAGDEDLIFDSVVPNYILIDVPAVDGGVADPIPTVWVKDNAGITVCSPAAAVASTYTCAFDGGSVTIAGHTSKTLKVYADTSAYGGSDSSIHLELLDTADSNMSFSTKDSTSDYQRATIIFRGNLIGGTLSN